MRGHHVVVNWFGCSGSGRTVDYVSESTTLLYTVRVHLLIRAALNVFTALCLCTESSIVWFLGSWRRGVRHSQRAGLVRVKQATEDGRERDSHLRDLGP